MFDSTMNREGKLYVFGVVIIHIFFLYILLFTWILTKTLNLSKWLMIDLERVFENLKFLLQLLSYRGASLICQIKDMKMYLNFETKIFTHKTHKYSETFSWRYKRILWFFIVRFRNIEVLYTTNNITVTSISNMIVIILILYYYIVSVLVQLGSDLTVSNVVSVPRQTERVPAPPASRRPGRTPARPPPGESQHASPTALTHQLGGKASLCLNVLYIK